ncbi:cupin domain-containing protein [Fundidesulfovibrio terrae]|uniref:cupin domain-containing protein n=1 Tax=Fundidesulfovibrio terrae TaxID=2922866 RepID=UPI001FB00CAE
MKALDLKKAVSGIDALWSPRVAAKINDTFVKLARIQGDFVWHAHEHEDEMFVVLKGRLCIKLRDGDVWLEEGQALAIPRGVEHCPHAPEEVHIMLIEPATTVNTGDATGDERTQGETLYLEG